MSTWGELAVNAVLAVTGGGAITTAANAYFSRRTTQTAIKKTQTETGKTEAEIRDVGAGTAAVQVDTSLDILREMRIDLTRARDEAHAATEEVRELRADVDHLRGLLTAHGIPIPARSPPAVP